jgi:hypothetical protein
MSGSSVARWYMYFQTKNPDLGKFWMAMQWKMLVFLMAILSKLQLHGIFYGHLAHLGVIWYIFTVLVFCTYRKHLLSLSGSGN